VKARTARRIFVSYSHKDEAWKDRVVTHLGVLAQDGKLEIWEDRRIGGGADWRREIARAIRSCDVALLLVSADFLTSGFILGEEVPDLLKRRIEDGIRVIPVILKPCAWRKISWLNGLQASSKDGKPLLGMTEHDAESALSALAEEVVEGRPAVSRLHELPTENESRRPGGVSEGRGGSLGGNETNSVFVQGENNTGISASGQNAKAGGHGSVIVGAIHGNVIVDNRVIRGDSENSLDAAIGEYRRKVEAMYAKLPAAGFATQLKIPIAMDDLYVPLRATVNLGFRDGDGEVWASAEDAEKRLGHCREAAELDLDTAFAEAGRRSMPGLAILGDPGSGKTMHLQRLLLRCLRDPEKLGLAKDMLPIFLPLRELQDLDHGLACFIQQQLAKPHWGAASDFGARLLARGKLLFLLDGLDEVADPSRRREVALWVEEAAKLHADCRFAVTCRYAGYTPEVQLGALFLELHIRPLSATQADELVRRWYGIVEKGLATDSAAAEVAAVVAREKADELIRLLHGPDFRARRVFELTRNPLLLINICLVHRWRNQLPKGRARLYRECTDVLLEHWQGSKKLQLGLEAEQSRRVLQPVACWLHQKDGRTRATAAELTPVLAPALAAVKWSGGSARDFLARVRDVSGLLTGWDHEHFGFMHLGFQEYLAARDVRGRAYADASVLRELAGHFGESWWQEVTLLLLALEEPSLFVPFMRELVKLPAFAAHPDLVEACLDDAAEVSSQPFVELLRQPAGRDEGLWLRQALALRLVQRLEPAALDVLGPALAAHPSAEIRALLGARRGRDTLVAPRGGYELVRIPAGNFLMGSPATEVGRYVDEGPPHRVSLAEFHLGRYPVTNEEYARFLEANPKVAPPGYWDNRQFNRPRQPVVGVSWPEAMAYAAWAGLRLPSEAEWEYACRAGTETAFNDGSACTAPDGKDAALERLGWYDKNSGNSTHPVGEKEPNAWGLYDMHGNVWEWCADHWHGNYNGAPADGSAWVNADATEGADRVVRGGSWFFSAWRCRSASRRWFVPSDRLFSLGFRLVLAPSSTVEPVRSLEHEQAGQSARRAER
jgi:formylglycine-generating enzyme required for sulfatase activity